MNNYITITRYNSRCIIDSDNNELIPSRRYLDIWTTYDSYGKYFVVTDFNKKKGIYEIGNKEIVPCIYDDIEMFGDHGFVTKGERSAVISNDFKVVSDFIFEDVFVFNKDGLAIVKKDARWVLIDTNATIIKQLPYDEVVNFNEDEVYRKAGINNTYGFIDKNYKIIIPFEYEDVGTQINGTNDLFPVKKGGKWGYVNKLNKVIVPLNYFYVTPMEDGYGRIKDSNYNTVGLVDANGIVLIDDDRIVDIGDEEEGKFIYSIKEPTSGERIKGYLDCRTFKVLIEPQFERCESFHNGLAIVESYGYFGVIDTIGNVVIPFKYNSINMWGDKYLVILNRKVGMIDNNGEIIVPFLYDSYACSGPTTDIIKDGLVGIMDSSGKILVAPKYNFIQAISDEVFYASKGDKKYLVNIDGTEKNIE